MGRVFLAPLVTVGLLAALAAVSPATAPAEPSPEYFPLPSGRALERGIAVDTAGNVWVGAAAATFAEAPLLARLVPGESSPGTSNGISYFPTPEFGSEPCCAKQIRGLALDPTNGHLRWVSSTGALGDAAPSMMSPGTSDGMHVAETPGDPDLGGIAVAPDGRAWFTENSAYNVSPYPGNRVAYADGLTIHQYPDLWHQIGDTDSSRYDAKPAGITIGAEGSAWFAESDSGLPGYRLTKALSGDLYEEHLLTPCEPSPPCSGSYTSTGPWAVATAPDGSIWFTNLLKNTFGKLDPESGTITQYGLTALDARLAGGEPFALTAAPDGTLWLAERGFISHPEANALVRIVPSDPPTATVYGLGSGHAPLSVAADSAGDLWFGVHDVGSGEIGRLVGVIGSTSSEEGGGSGAAPEPPPGEIAVSPASVGAKVTKVRVKGESVTVNQICIGPPSEPCAVVYLLEAGEYVHGFPGTKPRTSATASAHHRRPTRRVVVGTKSVKIPGGRSKKVTIKLNGKGRKILRRDGVLHATLRVFQKLKGKKKKQSKKALAAKKLTFHGH